MIPQHSLTQKLIVPFLIGVLILTGYLIFRNNPEIMNPHPYYETLTKKRTDAEARVLNPSFDETFFSDSTSSETGRLHHRYIEVSKESYTPIPLPEKSVQWFTTGQYAIANSSSKIVTARTSGEELWTFELPKGLFFSQGRLHRLGQTVYFSTQNGRVYAFHIESGQLVWYLSTTGHFFHAPIVAGDNLLLFSEEKANLNWTLFVVNAKTGEIKNQFEKLELPLAGSPIAHGDTLYFATKNGHLNAIQLATGKPAWTSEGSSSFRSGPSLIGERIFLTNEDGFALGFDRKNGRKTLEIELGSAIQEPLVPVDGTNFVVTVDMNGFLIAMDLREAKRKWRYHLNWNGPNRTPQIHRLSSASLTQLNFNSEVRGLTIWTYCSETRICIFDVKEGRLLHRIDLKGIPLAPFALVNPSTGTPPHLLAPVMREGRSEVIKLENPPPKTTLTNPPAQPSF